MLDYEILDADTEEPNCLNCVHVCGGFDCEGHCGPKHWWAGFTPIERGGGHA